MDNHSTIVRRAGILFAGMAAGSAYHYIFPQVLDFAKPYINVAFNRITDTSILYNNTNSVPSTAAIVFTTPSTTARRHRDFVFATYSAPTVSLRTSFTASAVSNPLSKMAYRTLEDPRGEISMAEFVAASRSIRPVAPETPVNPVDFKIATPVVEAETTETIKTAETMKSVKTVEATEKTETTAKETATERAIKIIASSSGLIGALSPAPPLTPEEQDDMKRRQKTLKRKRTMQRKRQCLEEIGATPEQIDAIVGPQQIIFTEEELEISVRGQSPSSGQAFRCRWE
ncbi:hypothetical protein IAT38_007721 [Cryptococcus sp. DSM 104549]